ncbi:hypothetical protein DERP_013698, partial [Dermatophagoides pteronyssinus]
KPAAPNKPPLIPAPHSVAENIAPNIAKFFAYDIDLDFISRKTSRTVCFGAFNGASSGPTLAVNSPIAAPRPKPATQLSVVLNTQLSKKFSTIR